MKFSSLIHYLKYYWQFVPFRFNFILFAIILAVLAHFLKAYNVETSSFKGIIFLMAKIALIFTIVVTSISFLSALFCFLFFQIQLKRRHQEVLEIKLDTSSYKNHLLKIESKLPFALKPVLGFVKLRLIYDHTQMTERFIMNGRMKKQFFSFKSGLAGNNTLILPDIKEYYFSKVIIYFEDMLQFFSFASSAPISTNICNLPHSLLHEVDETLPKKTEEEKVRIEQLRKVEGEHLNYKKFENSDDVRRIVWKIFAKNKELVVRIPEVIDPFASHIYMYASFYNSLQHALYHDYQQEMMNHFKNCVWTIYDALTSQEFVVRFIADQAITNPHPEIDLNQYTIAVSNWHQDKHLNEYYKARNGSVLCIHSFTPLNEINDVLMNSDSNTTIFFIQLSNVFKSHYILNWMLRLFMKPPPDRLYSLRNKWAIHPLKFQTLHNEKEIISVLKNSELTIEII